MTSGEMEMLTGDERPELFGLTSTSPVLPVVELLDCWLLAPPVQVKVLPVGANRSSSRSRVGLAQCTRLTGFLDLRPKSD